MPVARSTSEASVQGTQSRTIVLLPLHYLLKACAKDLSFEMIYNEIYLPVVLVREEDAPKPFE
jgi:hypothetical protein